MVDFAVNHEERDRDLERRIVNFLADRQIPNLRNLIVAVEGGVVTLRGRVRSFYEKQMSQLCCRRVAGVVGLVDEIHVQDEVESASYGA